jgi:TonB family protein
VKIYVSASGAVERAELISPSGSTSLDREALALPSRTGSVPPPPGGATTVTVPITWKLLTSWSGIPLRHRLRPEPDGPAAEEGTGAIAFFFAMTCRTAGKSVAGCN